MRKHTDYPHVNIGRKDAVVVYERNGRLWLRSHTDPLNPRTPEQQSNRSRYGMLTEISAIVKPFRAFCFQRQPGYQNSHTAFVGIQMMWLKNLDKCGRNALIREIRWSTGRKMPPFQVSINASRTFLHWENETHTSALRDQNDQVLWIAYDCQTESWKWTLNAGRRVAGSCLIELPENWGRGESCLWLLFYDSAHREFSRAVLLVMPPGKVPVYTRYSPSKQDLTAEDQVIDIWLESRRLRGKEQQEFLNRHKDALRWRPWMKRET